MTQVATPDRQTALIPRNDGLPYGEIGDVRLQRGLIGV